MASATSADTRIFGQALAAARRRAGLTQEELAKQIGSTQTAITRLETGRFLPAIRTLRRLSRALGVIFEIGGEDGLVVRYDRQQTPTLADLRARREEILNAAAAEGAVNVRVFGSVARSQATPSSDIDFVVDFKPGYSLMDLSGLHLSLEALVGRQVHVTTLPEQPSSERERRMAERIRREAIPL